ncbi:Ig-like domain-containing protein [Saccharicrinis sp. FJH62]|uniref:Ig-like domain-containing protein n=1 Tax=Saccharicrinis sp. FJH62 TaxID=3344657 RepID=UPI0035D480B7
MKNSTFILTSFLFLLVSSAGTYAQITENDGDWSEKYVSLSNTPEAEFMVRTGDIDNLGFGWPVNFDPFSGNSTPGHGFPWTPDETDPSGTDRIMVITSYVGTPPYGRDGYTSGTSRPSNSVRPIQLTFSDTFNIGSAEIQMFVDDFQAPVWGSHYVVLLDSLRNSDLENIINALVQTGPIGKMITYTIPENLLYLLGDGKLAIEFDDFTTGAGDGYAIDFIKLLINPVDTSNNNTVISGTVTDKTSGNPLEGVIVSTNDNRKDTTDVYGKYAIHNVKPGIVHVNTFKPTYGAESKVVDIRKDQTITADFQLLSPSPQLMFSTPEDGENDVEQNRIIKLLFDQYIDLSTFNSTSFILSGQLQDVAGQFSYSGDTLIFEPDTLRPGTRYFITITTNLKNSAGVRLDQNIVISFKTSGSNAVTTTDAGGEYLSIYPNPVGDVINITYNDNVKYYTLYNTVGKVLQKGVISGSIAFEKELNCGIYLIQVSDSDQRPLTCKKLFKK